MKRADRNDVVNAFNIQVQGTTIGIPTAPAPNLGAMVGQYPVGTGDAASLVIVINYRRHQI
jgi:hypothetical protein